MSKKKVILIVLLLLIIVVLGAGAWFYRQNLRGAGPAVLPPSGNIENTLPPAGPPGTGVNSTGMPLQLPAGFSISVYAKQLGDPRALALDPVGRLVVSIPGQGKVVAFDDQNGAANSPIPVVENLTKPHGIVFRCELGGVCKLFVAETNAVRMYIYDVSKAKTDKGTKILDLSSGGNHTSRSLAIIHTPNGPRLLISIGSSCNVCNEKDEQRASIWSANLDGSDFKPYATGLRNSVFLITDPVTSKLWATEMGRDLLGDNTPPDEVNIIEEGKDYGWPICYGKNIHDTDFDRNTYIQDPCNSKVASHIDLQAHSAPLGLAFIPAQGWPKEYSHNLLVAFHGSWNRTTPTGYKIVRMQIDEHGTVTATSDFLTGFLATNGKTALGRPVDILALAGGKMYVSDDKAGLIYKIEYQQQ